MKEKLDFIVQREGRRMSDIREEEIPRCLMLSSPEATGHLTFVPLPASSLLRTTFFSWGLKSETREGVRSILQLLQEPETQRNLSRNTRPRFQSFLSFPQPRLPGWLAFCLARSAQPGPASDLDPPTQTNKRRFRSLYHRQHKASRPDRGRIRAGS